MIRRGDASEGGMDGGGPMITRPEETAAALLAVS